MNARQYGLFALFLIMAVVLMARCEAASDDLEVFAGEDKFASVHETVQFDDARIVTPSPLNEDSTYTLDWDFDDSTDDDMDGILDNDNESGEVAPEWAYHRSGVYVVTVTLTERDDRRVRVAKDTLKVVVDSPWIKAMVVGADSYYLQQDVVTTVDVAVADASEGYPWKGTLDLRMARSSDGWSATLDDWNITLNGSGASVSLSSEFTAVSEGNYTITATLYGDREERVDSAALDIQVIGTVYNPPPSAVIALVDKRLRVGELCYLSGSGSKDPNGFIVTYSWDMGDGIFLDGDEVFHRYSEPGLYDVRLVVLDNEGVPGETVVVVEVIEVQPIAPDPVKNGSAPSSDDGGSVGPQRIVTASLVVVVLLGITLATEVGRTSMLGLLVPLYTRLRKKDVLDHFTRGKVYGYVIANPGDHISSIRSSLNIPNGTLVYHLQVLERECFVKSRRDGMYKRFYPYDMRIPDDRTGLKESQRMILRTIKDAPGISQRGIASCLGISASSVCYHMVDLVEEGMVIKERRGIKMRCFLSPKSESLGL